MCIAIVNTVMLLVFFLCFYRYSTSTEHIATCILSDFKNKTNIKQIDPL